MGVVYAYLNDVTRPWASIQRANFDSSFYWKLGNDTSLQRVSLTL